MAPKDHDAVLRQLREELVKEDLLHDGDSIGTEDYVLLYVSALNWFLYLFTDMQLDDSFARDSSMSSKQR